MRSLLLFFVALGCLWASGDAIAGIECGYKTASVTVGSGSTATTETQYVYQCWLTPYTSSSGSEGGGGGGGTMGGGGGGAGIYTAPDSPYQHTQATCHSDGETRYYHAATDFAYWKLKNRPTQLTGRGELIQIKYDDGGTENYLWIPGSIADSTVPPETYLGRIASTLKCPTP